MNNSSWIRDGSCISTDMNPAALGCDVGQTTKKEEGAYHFLLLKLSLVVGVIFTRFLRLSSQVSRTYLRQLYHLSRFGYPLVRCWLTYLEVFSLSSYSPYTIIIPYIFNRSSNIFIFIKIIFDVPESADGAVY